MSKEANSVFQIWWRTRKHLKQEDSWNTSLPYVLSVMVFIIDVYMGISTRAMIQSTASTLLALNGGVLGFTIAGFGIFQSIPKAILTHAVTNQAEGYPWSFYKLMLLNYVHVLFVTFLSVCFLIIFYFASYIPLSNYVYPAKELCQCLTFQVPITHIGKSLLLAGIIFVQMMVMIKLKVFLFWIYDNSLMVAMAAAKKDHDDDPTKFDPPFDERND
jgi:hypothetical protein